MEYDKIRSIFEKALEILDIKDRILMRDKFLKELEKEMKIEFAEMTDYLEKESETLLRDTEIYKYHMERK